MTATCIGGHDDDPPLALPEPSDSPDMEVPF